MSVLLVSADLATSSKVAAASARLGRALDVAANMAEFHSKWSAGRATLVVLDLTTQGLDVPTVVASVRKRAEPQATIIAFGPHVHATRLAEARDAGCDRVLSRGTWHAQIDAIIAG